MASTSDHHALLIATNSYASLPDLVAPHDDAAAMEEVLADPDIGGYQVRSLRDPSVQPAMREIEAFCRARGARDLTLLYISGHGVLDDEGRLVFPLTDSDPASLQSSALSASWLGERLQDCRSRRLLLIVDTCFSGAVSAGVAGPRRWISAVDHFGASHGFVALTSANNRQEAFQRPDETEGRRLSVFTYHLVQALATGDADRNGDGHISVGELYSYLVDAIQADGSAQIPSRAGYEEGDFQLARSRKSAGWRGGDRDAADPATSLDSLRQIYLRWVKAQTERLDLSIIERDFSKSAVDVRSVYSPLSTRTRLNLDVRQAELANWSVASSGARATDSGPINTRAQRDRLEPLISRIRSLIRRQVYSGVGIPDGSYPYDLSTADAVALSERLVLTGAPGSGKTTLARHLALSLAESALADQTAETEDTDYWGLPPLLPIFIRLHDLVTRSFPTVQEPISLGDFTHYLKGQLARSGLSVSSLDEVVFNDLAAGRVLLILDGLDEIPEAHSKDRRSQIVSLVELISVAYPKTRILVTSRPHAYAGDWVLPGFAHEELAPLSAAQAEQIALNIFNLVFSVPENASEQAFDFVAALGRIRDELQTDPSLWSSPLLLSLMCALWLRRSHAASAGSLPTTRGGLYREAVDLLIERWTTRDKTQDYSLTDLLQMSPGGVRTALERLALVCHGRLGEERRAISSFTYGDLLDSVLTVDPAARVNTFELAEFLSHRSGILVELAPNQLAFTHFSFQEHLAACWLTRPELFPDRIQGLVLADPQRWSDVADLVAAECEFRGRQGDVRSLVLGLLDGHGAAVLPDRSWSCVVVAAVLFRRYLYRPGEAPMESTLGQSLRDRIIEALGAGALGAQDQAFLGRTLSELGDSRAGVGLTGAGIPDIAWSETISMDDGTDTAPFQVSLYAVTNQQFEAFLSAENGYVNTQWWTQPGIESVLRLGGPAGVPEPAWSANFPYVNVSWYEADAFTKWLAAELATEIRLPSSAEWRAAARGPESLEYPYGNEFDGAANNSAFTGLLSACAVGLFPRGRSPYGLFDLGGNVFEWTSTPWPEPREDSPASMDSSYIVCGAAYDSRDPECMKSDYSFPRRPASRVPQRGFRLCRRA
jgi:energy-coupling factor transporter ATP-binding protein EcfA2